jgi:hypothetical protein
MKSKSLSLLVSANLALLVAWLGILIAQNMLRAPVTDFAAAIAFAREGHWLFYRLTYINAVLFTLTGVAVYAGLYGLLRDRYPIGAAIGFVFVPIYGILALAAYLSQLVLVPRLLDLYSQPEFQTTADLLLRQLLQLAPDSALIYFDQFSYAVVGVSALLFGLMLMREGPPYRLAGLLLGLSGLTGPFVALGIFAAIPPLVEWASMAGGILAMLAYIPLAWGLWHGPATEREPRLYFGM